MRLGFAENVIERVCYLIGHHHTYTGIEGRDYQILVEADFLVNLYEDGRPDGDGGFMPDKAAVETAYQRILRRRPENGSVGACLHFEVCHDAGKEAEGKNSGIQFQGNLLSVQQLFANQIGAAFEELGYEVTVCELSKEDDLDAKLARYIGQPYRLILDFNSLLPRMVLDDGTPYVDRLAGPFLTIF